MTFKTPYRPAYLCVCYLYCKEVQFFQWHKHTYVHFGSVFSFFFFATWSDGDITYKEEWGNYIRKEKWALFINLLYEKSYDKLSMWHFTNDVFVSWIFFLFACPCPLCWNLCTKQKRNGERETHICVHTSPHN